MTLATMIVWREALRWSTGGAWVEGLPANFQWFGLGQQAGQAVIVSMVALLLFGVFWWCSENLSAFRAIYATGSDSEAARLAGIPVKLVLFGVFVLMGALTGVAAMLNAVRFSDVPANSGMNLELEAIAAVVVGGAPITGGRGSLLGTFIGVLLLGSIGPALTFLGVNPYWEKAIQGTIILATVLFDAVRHRASRKAAGSRLRPPVNKNRKQEWILAAFIAAEILLFSFTGRNFLSVANFFECVRLAVEIGLLALALTPVIVTGGIDLSVGSMMGMCAVTFGALWSDAHLSIAISIALALLVSLLGGTLNALLISRLNVSPLIVTLGTFSLFRGIAEGITAGARNYSGFPSHFLYLGQGYLGGVVPPQSIPVAARHRRILLSPAADDNRPRPLRYRPFSRRGTLCRSAGWFTFGPGLRSFGACRWFGGNCVRSPSRPSEIGRRNRLRAHCDHCGSPGWYFHFWRVGHDFRNADGLGGDCCSAKWFAPPSAWPTELAGISTGTLLILTIAIERWVNKEGRRKTTPALRFGAAGVVAALGALIFLLFRTPCKQRSRTALRPVSA